MINKWMSTEKNLPEKEELCFFLEENSSSFSRSHKTICRGCLAKDGRWYSQKSLSYVKAENVHFWMAFPKPEEMIPCTAALPKNHSSVIVRTEDGKTALAEFQLAYDEETQSYTKEFYWIYVNAFGEPIRLNVTHWTEIPSVHAA